MRCSKEPVKSYEVVIRLDPAETAELWKSLNHVLTIAGTRDKCEAAFNFMMALAAPKEL